jgi:hypothetical protein
MYNTVVLNKLAYYICHFNHISMRRGEFDGLAHE